MQKTKKFYYALFNYIDCIKLPIYVVNACSHSGQCDSDIEVCRMLPYVKKQLDVIDPIKLAKELNEYGAWDDTELSNHNLNIDRILWIAANNISDEIYSYSK